MRGNYRRPDGRQAMHQLRRAWPPISKRTNAAVLRTSARQRRCLPAQLPRRALLRCLGNPAAELP